MSQDGRSWALHVLKSAALRGPEPIFTLLQGSYQDVSTWKERPEHLDPDQLKYIRQLVSCLLAGRQLIATYNIVLLVVLALFTVSHLINNIKDKRKAAHAVLHAHDDTTTRQEEPYLDDDDVTPADVSSSSSSTYQGTSSPPRVPKLDQIEGERLPLLSTRLPRASVTTWGWHIIKAWLMHQPRPMPIFQRSLPHNAASLFVLTYYGLVVFYHFYRVGSLEPQYAFAFFDRCGLIFVANLPLLYLLAAKNQPLKLLTGRSYEALNIYHRRVGELMCLEAVLHFVGIVVWKGFLAPRWLTPADEGWSYFFTRPIIVFGLVAFASYEILFVTSLGSFRARWYELFLASHVSLQLIALVFLWLHFPFARPYVYAAVAIFVVDRIAWRMGMKSARFATAELTILEDGHTLLLSADWAIIRPSNQKRRTIFSRIFRRNDIRHGWRPADHVFLTVPALGRTHALQAHPFTIASAAPAPPAECGHDHYQAEQQQHQQQQHAWLSLLIREQSGFTSALLSHARSHTSVPIRLDGPYGSSEPLTMLRSQETAVLIAGGSGIAVVFPLIWDLAHSLHHHHHQPTTTTTTTTSTRPPSACRKIHLFWVVHSPEQQSWIPAERIEELRGMGVEVVMPPPTIISGRPDVRGFVEEMAVVAASSSMGVVVSGPDGLNRETRNACAESVRRGADVRLRVEKFGW